MKMKARALAALGGALLVAVSHPSFATENGDTNWPLGVNTVLPALLPPPGATALYGYTVHYGSSSLKNQSGDSVPVDFKIDNYIQAFRLVHTWQPTTDSGLRFSSGVIGSVQRSQVKVGGASDEKFGLKQLYVTPLYITYSPSENLHILTGFSAFIPTGNYSKGDLANTTSNYMSYTQEFGLTWFPTRDIEISVSPTISFNQKNSATDYRSGNILNVDFNAGYQVPGLSQLQAGVAGYYTVQLTDDVQNGSVLTNGNRLRKFAIGPQLFYAFDKSSGVVFKWLNETSVRNGPKGNSLWFEFVLPL